TPPFGPNYTLTPTDFPFHKLSDPNNTNSTVLKDTNDVASSQGVFNSTFGSVSPGQAADNCTKPDPADPVFNVGGINTRRVEPRNTPSVFNAAFNFRNFWDGRANNNFNGVNPFGLRDPNARVFHINATTGQLEQVRVSIPFSSLASQATGPPV